MQRLFGKVRNDNPATRDMFFEVQLDLEAGRMERMDFIDEAQLRERLLDLDTSENALDTAVREIKNRLW